MNVEQADEGTPAGDLNASATVGDSVRDYYGDVSKEAIPNRFNDLLRRFTCPRKVIPKSKNQSIDQTTGKPMAWLSTSRCPWNV
jgi:hypothetical protein